VSGAAGVPWISVVSRGHRKKRQAWGCAEKDGGDEARRCYLLWGRGATMVVVVGGVAASDDRRCSNRRRYNGLPLLLQLAATLLLAAVAVVPKAHRGLLPVVASATMRQVLRRQS
jgi:hypothetical protein